MYNKRICPQNETRDFRSDGGAAAVRQSAAAAAVAFLRRGSMLPPRAARTDGSLPKQITTAAYFNNNNKNAIPPSGPNPVPPASVGLFDRVRAKNACGVPQHTTLYRRPSRLENVFTRKNSIFFFSLSTRIDRTRFSGRRPRSRNTAENIAAVFFTSTSVPLHDISKLEPKQTA